MPKNAYSVKNLSTDAVISCILGGISVLFILVAIIASYQYAGKGPAIVGFFGIGSLILSACGILFSISAWKSQDGGFLMKRTATLLNIIPLVMAVIIFIIGCFM